MKRYDRLENWQRRGEAAERNLEHNHRASHTDNLTVLRMRKTGYGCLSCQHCKDLSRRMAFREQFRWTGECLACLSPQRLADIELPPQYDPLRELKNIRRRTQRLEAKAQHWETIIKLHEDHAETLAAENEAREARRDDLDREIAQRRVQLAQLV